MRALLLYPATYDDVSSVQNLNTFVGKLCAAIEEAGNPGVGKRVRALVRSDSFRARQRLLLAYPLPPVPDLE